MAYKRRPGQKAPDMRLLTEADMDMIRQDAEEKVAAERHAAAVAEASAIAIEEERAKFDPTLEMTDVLIDLPANANRLLINFHPYNHGEYAHVSRPLAASITDQMERMWEIEKLSGNPNLSGYKPIRNYNVNAKTGEAHSAPSPLNRM